MPGHTGDFVSAHRRAAQAEQLFCVFVCADGGRDLEGWEFTCYAEARSMLLQARRAAHKRSESGSPAAKSAEQR